MNWCCNVRERLGTQEFPERLGEARQDCNLRWSPFDVTTDEMVILLRRNGIELMTDSRKHYANYNFRGIVDLTK